MTLKFTHDQLTKIASLRGAKGAGPSPLMTHFWDPFMLAFPGFSVRQVRYYVFNKKNNKKNNKKKSVAGRELKRKASVDGHGAVDDE